MVKDYRNKTSGLFVVSGGYNIFSINTPESKTSNSVHVKSKFWTACVN